jgi:small subunit ribosomal protein S2
MIDFRSLVKAGVHFGHQTTRWCPKMAPYIWGSKNNVHLIDVSKTAIQMERAAKFLHDIAAEGKQIMWVGTKKAARDVVTKAGSDLHQPYVYHRWIGGTLSNNTQVKKSVTKLLHYEDVINKADMFPHYTKKEFNVFQKMVERLKKNVGGIRNLTWPLGAIVLIDVTKERSALKEAAIMGVPVVALVDTNSDPSFVDYVIPANDDAPKAIELVVDYLAQAVAKGLEAAKQRQQEAGSAQDAAAAGRRTEENTENTLKEFEKELAESDAKDAQKRMARKRPAGAGHAAGQARRPHGPQRPRTDHKPRP